MHFLRGTWAEFGRIHMDAELGPFIPAQQRGLSEIGTEKSPRGSEKKPGLPQGRHGARTFGLILRVVRTSPADLDSKAA